MNSPSPQQLPRQPADENHFQGAATVEETTTAVRMLRAQRVKQLFDALPPLKAERANADRQLSALLLDFQRNAAAHGIVLPLTETTQPYPVHDETALARHYRVGGWACTVLGVLVFSLACTGSLNFPVPDVVLFLGCTVVGFLLGMAVNTATCLLTGASASNPRASRKIVMLGRISGTLAALSAAAFLLLRFLATAMAPTLISVILVCFEASVFLLGAALEAGYELNAWSERLTSKYQEVLAVRDGLQNRLLVTELELQELTTVSVHRIENSSLKEVDHANTKSDSYDSEDRHDHSLPVNGISTRIGTRSTVNGSGKLRNTDGLGGS